MLLGYDIRRWREARGLRRITKRRAHDVVEHAVQHGDSIECGKHGNPPWLGSEERFVPLVASRLRPSAGTSNAGTLAVNTPGNEIRSHQGQGYGTASALRSCRAFAPLVASSGVAALVAAGSSSCSSQSLDDS